MADALAILQAEKLTSTTVLEVGRCNVQLKSNLMTFERSACYKTQICISRLQWIFANRTTNLVPSLSSHQKQNGPCHVAARNQCLLHVSKNVLSLYNVQKDDRNKMHAGKRAVQPCQEHKNAMHMICVSKLLIGHLRHMIFHLAMTWEEERLGKNNKFNKEINCSIFLAFFLLDWV